MKPLGLFLLIIWSMVVHSADPECTQRLSAKPWERLVATAIKGHLHEDTSYVIRIKVLQGSKVKIKKLNQRAEKFAVSLASWPHSPSESESDVDLEISGNGGAIVQALIEIERTLPPNSIFWLDPSKSSQDPTLAVPPPHGLDLEKVARLSLRDPSLGLSPRALNPLLNDNLLFVGDLVHKSKGELGRIPNLGKKSLLEIQTALAGLGLALGSEVPGWPYEDLYGIPMSFAKSGTPEFSIEQWLAREPNQASAIFEESWNGLSLQRPIARMTTSDPALTYFFVNGEYFAEQEPEVLAQALEGARIRRRLFERSEQAQNEVLAQLIKWKADKEFKTITIDETLGKDGAKNFKNASRRSQPFFVGDPSGRRVVILPWNDDSESSGGGMTTR